MKITKTSAKTYEVLGIYPYPPTWGKFKATREKYHLPVAKFERCFSCNHKFSEDEKLYVMVVKPEGNKLVCEKCAEKYKQEANHA